MKTLAAVLFGVLFATAALAQGGGEARPATGGASRLSPDAGGGQSPRQSAQDDLPGHTRASPAAHPSANPNAAGTAASDSTAGTSSPRSPEPKPD